MITEILEMVKTTKLPKASAMQILEKIKNPLNDYHKVFNYNNSYIKDHQVMGEYLLLGVTHCSEAINAFSQHFPLEICGGLKRVRFINPAQIHAETDTEIKIHIEVDTKVKFTSEYRNTLNPAWKISAQGEFIIGPYSVVAETINLQELQTQSKYNLAGEEFYKKLKHVKYGPSLFTIDHVYWDDSLTLAKLSVKTNSDYHLHPAILDGALLSLMTPFLQQDSDIFIPLSIDEIRFSNTVTNSAWCLGKITKNTEEIIQCDFTLCNDNGDVLLKIIGFSCKRLQNKEVLLRNLQTVELKPQPLPSYSKSSQLHENIILYLKNIIKKHLPQTDMEIAANKNFMEMGIDSVSLIEIAGKIEAEIKIELYPTIFFEYPNINELADYFAKNYVEPLHRYFFKEDAPQAQASITPVPHATIQNTQTTENKNSDHDIAVIGIAGKFAGSQDVDMFWQHLVTSTDLMSEIPKNRFDHKSVYDASGQPADNMYCKWGSFIDGVDEFDADFFNITRSEAEVMDPQLRHLLQVTYLAAENAGYINSIRGSNAGIYVGCCFYDYQTDMLINHKPIDVYDGIGNSATMLANRQSFYFDLKGPSMTVDTSCSSSLVALHLACQALQNDECETAFVAGANLLLTPGHYQYFCRIGALGHTGRCHSFDAKADGYIPGEGIATVLLKPLSKAIADNDHIYGVIKGTAVKHGGYSSSVTAPNVKGEEAVLLKAWQNAGIDPQTISYIEAHGTGTALGDPIEFQAVENAFKKFPHKPQQCILGSAKAHVGHLEGAAGITGLIKVLLAMQHKTIPAMPKFEKVNPFIRLENSPLYFNAEPVEWKSESSPRRAGINSFGFGGTFCHVVVEEYPQLEQASSEAEATLILLSAKSQNQLQEKSAQLSQFLTASHNLKLRDIAYTLQTGRENMPFRLAILTSNQNDLIAKLQVFSSDAKSIENVWFQNSALGNEVSQTFSSDPELNNVLQLYLDRTPRLNHLASLWTSGFDFDWKLLYKNKPAKMVSLPGYIFEKNSYWYKPLAETTKSEAGKVQAFKQSFKDLEKLSLQGLILQLDKIKFFVYLQKPRTIKAIMKKFNLLPKYQQLMESVLNSLLQADILAGNSATTFHVNPTLKIIDAETFTKEKELLDNKHAELRPFTAFLQHCLNSFINCLNGTEVSINVLFNAGTMRWVESIYRNEISNYFNLLLAEAVAAQIKEALASDKQKIRILELGAGTGATTQFVLNKIENYAEQIEYVYSDISPVFLDYAQKNFAGKYKFISTQLLDANKLDENNLIAEKFDLVIAANVLHATKNITATLRNINRHVLKQDGMLMVNELTQSQLFMTVTFGMLDGWWAFEDKSLRIEGSPLLNFTAWEKVLEKAGFALPIALNRIELGQTAFITRNIMASPVKQFHQGPALEAIQQIIADFFNKTPSEIDPDKYFMDLGIDSLKGIEFATTISNQFQVNLDMLTLISHPTPATLATYLDNNTKFSRFGNSQEKAEELKQKYAIQSKTEIDKLFVINTEVKETNIEKLLFQVLNPKTSAVKFIPTSLTTLEYVEAGNGNETLVLLSPLNTLSVVWQNQIEELSKYYRVICFHFPGFGRSQFVENIFDMDCIGDQIIEALQKIHCKPPFNLVGWSMGGLIGQAIAQKYPLLIKTLLLMGTGTISMFDNDYYNEHTHVKNILTQELNSSEYTPAALNANHDLMVGTYNTEVLMHYAYKIRDFDHKQKRNITAPVLIVNGSEDKILLTKYARELVKYIPGARFKEIKGGGHFQALTHPREINSIIRQFITRTQKSTSTTSRNTSNANSTL